MLGRTALKLPRLVACRNGWRELGARVGAVGPPIAPKRVVDVRESLSASVKLLFTRGDGWLSSAGEVSLDWLLSAAFLLSGVFLSDMLFAFAWF